MNTMVLEPKKKRFPESEAVETSIENIKKFHEVPCIKIVGVRIFEAWQAERENKLVMSEDNLFALDLTKVK